MAKHRITNAGRVFFGNAYHAKINTSENSPGGGVEWYPVQKFSLGNPRASDDDALIDAATSTELPNAATITYTFPGSASPLDNAAGQDGKADIPYGRTVAIARSLATGGGPAFSLKITGLNGLDETVSETVSLTATGTAGETAKSFKEVDSIAITSTGNLTTSTLNVGWGRKFGLPVRVAGKNDLLQVMHDGSPVTGWSVTVGDTTDPATATTDDVRGLLTVTTGINAALTSGKELTVYLVSAEPTDRESLYGISDYTGS